MPHFDPVFILADSSDVRTAARILGRGGEKGLEIDLGKQGVEVSGNFGETNQEWTAGLSN